MVSCRIAVVINAPRPKLNRLNGAAPKHTACLGHQDTQSQTLMARESESVCVECMSMSAKENPIILQQQTFRTKETQ